MLYLVNQLIFILAPVLLIAFGLTIYSLLRLLFLDLPKKQFWIWNFFILIILLIGAITFLICYYCFRKKVFASASIYKTKEHPTPESKDTDKNANNQDNQ